MDTQYRRGFMMHVGDIVRAMKGGGIQALLFEYLVHYVIPHGTEFSPRYSRYPSSMVLKTPTVLKDIPMVLNTHYTA